MGLILLLGLLFLSPDADAKVPQHTSPKLLHLQHQQTPTQTQRDIVTPTTTVPGYYPGNPTVITTPPYTTPASNPTMMPVYYSPATRAATSGQSWCIATPSASQTAVQVALDYACGDVGADCSAIQPGGSCYNPDAARDLASYAFNEYYQKNPIPTSCDFGGTAMITNTDPSTPGCTYPSTSTSSSVLNTTNPNGSGSTVFGSSPPVFGGTTTTSTSLQLLTTSSLIIISHNAFKIYR